MTTIPIKQQGFTLVELMVGLVIATLCMLMMLMMFKQISKISVSSSQDAEYEAQLQTGMLVIENFVQNAGFGSGKSADITISTYSDNPAVLWRYIPDLNATTVVYKCQGIAEEIKTEGNQQIHRLLLIKKEACGDGTHEALTAGTWSEAQAITSIKNTDTTPIFNYTLANGDCRPFGIDQENTGSKQLTLTATRPHLTEAAYDLKNIICLNNIKATT